MKLKNWNDITLRKLNELLKLAEHPDEYTFVNQLGVIYDDVDFENMPLQDFKKYVGALKFLSTDDVPRVKLQKIYTINGTEYDSHFDLTQINISQFIDFQSYIKKEDRKEEEILSVFFIPKGHQYNDGYDLKKALQDILDLPMPVIHTAAFFFVMLWLQLLSLFQSYLKEDIEKMDLTEKEKKMEVLKILEEVDFSNLASFPNY